MPPVLILSEKAEGDVVDVDDEFLFLNAAAIESGTYRFGVIGHGSDTSITIESANHLPCVFQSAEWEGFFVLRSRRM